MQTKRGSDSTETGIVFCDKHGNVKYIVEQQQKAQVAREMLSTGSSFREQCRTRNMQSRWKSSDFQLHEKRGGSYRRKRSVNGPKAFANTASLLSQSPAGPYQ